MSDPVTLFDAFYAGWCAHGAQQTPGGDSQDVTDAFREWRSEAPRRQRCSRDPNSCAAPFCGFPDCLKELATPEAR